MASGKTLDISQVGTLKKGNPTPASKPDCSIGSGRSTLAIVVEKEKVDRREGKELEKELVQRNRSPSMADEDTRSGKSEDEKGDNYENMEELILLMARWIRKQAKTKAVSKVQCETATAILDKIKNTARDMNGEKDYWRGRTEGRQEVMEMLQKIMKDERSQQRSITYAEAAKRDERGQEETGKENNPKVKAHKPQMRNVLIIRKEGARSEDIAKSMKGKIKPREEGINIRKMMNVKNGVAVEVETKMDLEKLKGNEGIRKAGFDLAEPKKKPPMILLYDVSKDLDYEEIEEETYERNFKDKMDWESFKKGFTVRKKLKGTEQCINVAVECNGEMREAIRKGGECLFLEWRSCRVKTYIDLPRCFNCQRHGHIGKYCKETAACPRCAGKHDLRKCDLKKEDKGKETCINCKREGKEDCNHDARDRNCPGYKRAERRYLQKIDHGI